MAQEDEDFRTKVLAALKALSDGLDLLKARVDALEARIDKIESIVAPSGMVPVRISYPTLEGVNVDDEEPQQEGLKNEEEVNVHSPDNVSNQVDEQDFEQMEIKAVEERENVEDVKEEQEERAGINTAQEESDFGMSQELAGALKALKIDKPSDFKSEETKILEDFFKLANKSDLIRREEFEDSVMTEEQRGEVTEGATGGEEPNPIEAEIKQSNTQLETKCDGMKPIKDTLKELKLTLYAESKCRLYYENLSKDMMGKYLVLLSKVEKEMHIHKEMCAKFADMEAKYKNTTEYKEETVEGVNAKSEKEGYVSVELLRQITAVSEAEAELRDGLHKAEAALNIATTKSSSWPANLVEGAEPDENDEQVKADCEVFLKMVMKNEPYERCKYMEKTLTIQKRTYDNFWKMIFRRLKLTLLEVAGSGSPLLMSLLLEFCVDKDVVDQKGNTALHHAAQEGSVDVGKALLQGSGIVIDALNSSQLTPLHVSLMAGHVAFSLMLITGGSNIHLRDESLNTPLHLAALSDNRVIVNALIVNGADVNAVNDDGETPLFKAATNDQRDVATDLVEAGADVLVADMYGSTPLHFAARHGSLNLFLFLKSLPDFADQADYPLIIAAMEGHAELVRIVIGQGASVNTVDSMEYSPLHYAAAIGNIEIAKHLIDHEANVNARNFEKCTPLHLSASRGHKRVCDYLLAKNCDVNALDAKERTPLHVSVLGKGNEYIIKLLIGKGACLEALDIEGKTPHDLALEFGNADIATLLAKKDTSKKLKKSPRKKRR